MELCQLLTERGSAHFSLGVVRLKYRCYCKKFNISEHEFKIHEGLFYFNNQTYSTYAWIVVLLHQSFITANKIVLHGIEY